MYLVVVCGRALSRPVEIVMIDLAPDRSSKTSHVNKSQHSLDAVLSKVWSHDDGGVTPFWYSNLFFKARIIIMAYKASVVHNDC